MILFFSSKWLIWTLSKLKLACSLKQVDKEIIAKAEMHMEEQHLLAKQGVCPTRLEEMAKPIREKLHQLHIHLIKMRREYAALRAKKSPAIRAKLQKYKADILHCQKEFQYALKTWAQAKKNLATMKN